MGKLSILISDDTDVRFIYGGSYGKKIVATSNNAPSIRIQASTDNFATTSDIIGAQNNYRNLHTSTDGDMPFFDADNNRAVGSSGFGVPADEGDTKYRLVLQAEATNTAWILFEG